MSVSKFTPAELEELRRADAEVDAEDMPLEYELDAELDIAASAQSRGKTDEQIASEKACSRSRYQATKEYYQEYNRKYYAEHKEQQRAYRHQYYLNHKADYREREKKYVKAHPDRVRERNREYAEKVKSDPEKLEAMRRSQREYRQKHKAEISQKAKERYRKSKEKESTPSENA